MRKIHEFCCDIYPRMLWIAYDNENGVKKTFTNFQEEAIEDVDFVGCYAVCINVSRKADEYKGVLIHYSKDLLGRGGSQIVSTISHESVHAANMIMEALGIKYNTYNDEHFAYLVGWIARKSWLVLQNIVYK